MASVTSKCLRATHTSLNRGDAEGDGHTFISGAGEGGGADGGVLVGHDRGGGGALRASISITDRALDGVGPVVCPGMARRGACGAAAIPEVP